MKLLIPPPVYMLLFALLMWLLSIYYPLYEWQINTQYIGMGLVILGLSVDVSSLFRFIVCKTTINPMKPQNCKALVTTGMYRFSRNPMYLGLLLLLTGWSMYLGVVSSLLLLPLFILVLTKMQIQPEEVILEEMFGESYLRYKSKVRRWL